MAAPMDTDPPPEPQLKVWIMSMNRHVSTDEIVRGLNKIEEEEVRKFCLNKPTRDECIRTMVSRLFPPIVMWHKYGSFTFAKAKAPTGKEYFKIKNPGETRCIGYSTADTGSFVGMAWAFGQMTEVVNIGIDVMKFSIPRQSTAIDYFESVRHKLTDLEQNDIRNGNADEVLLRRLLIVLTVKQAYIKAINQPPGFDFRRMECNLPRERFTVDGRTLKGWEIRMFKATLGIQRNGEVHEEVYQCCAMIFRGYPDQNRVYYNNKEGEGDTMLNFLKVDQIVKAYDGLGSKSSSSSRTRASSGAATAGATTAAPGQEGRRRVNGETQGRVRTAEDGRERSRVQRAQASVTH